MGSIQRVCGWFIRQRCILQVLRFLRCVLKRLGMILGTKIGFKTRRCLRRVLSMPLSISEVTIRNSLKV